MAPKGERRAKMIADIRRLRRDQVAITDAQQTVDVFNSRLAAGKETWFFPTIGAALLTRHHWLIVVCDSCGLTLDLDLTMKPRHPETTIRAALNDVRCPRCNGHGRSRITALQHHPSC